MVGQVVADLGILLWTAGWWWVSRVVVAAIGRVAEPVRGIAATASGVSDDVAVAGDRLGRTPLLGRELAEPFGSAAGRLDRLVADAEQQAVAIDKLATLTGMVVFLLPVLAAVAVWLPARVRFARRAAAARNLLDSGVALDLFAWRALANQPLRVIAEVGTDPVGDLRRGRPEVVEALARAELRDCGLELPPGHPC
jgi:hypothetical protein